MSCIKKMILTFFLLMWYLADVNALVIECPNTLCTDKEDGNYAYPNNSSFYVSCVSGKSYCRFCWPLKLHYNEYCDQCLWSARTNQCYPPRIIGKVPPSWAEWSVYSSCSATCGNGVQTRTRLCNDMTGSCQGNSRETQRCIEKTCNDKASFQETLQLSLSILEKFFESIYPGPKLTGKLQRAMLLIQKAVALEANLDNNNTDSEDRLNTLISIFGHAIRTKNAAFSRETLGKVVKVFIKKKLISSSNATQHNIIDEGVTVLKSIRQDIEPQFDSVLASNGEATLMFAIDTTGSMKEEILEAQKIVSSIVKSVKGNPIDCILSPFNDPNTGPVTKASSDDLNKCVADIEKLEAALGGDCPELAYKGMIDAVREGPKFGSPMFVFTDASAKDNTPENIAELKRIAEENAITINFLLTQSTCLKSDNEYATIASSTNGQIFPLEERELANLVAYVKSSLFIDTSITIGRSDSATKYFDVDTEIFLLMVTVTVKNQDSAKFVKLFDPNLVVKESTETLSTVCVFEVVNPAAGRWSLSFPTRVGNLTFNVEAIAEKPIEFGFNFFAEVEDIIYTVFHPVAGRNNTVLITLAGSKLVKPGSLTLNIIDELGAPLLNDISLHQSGFESTFNASFMPPAISFKLLLRGVKKDNSNFQRVSRQLINVQSSFLQVAIAGNESTVHLAERNAPIKIQLFNTGVALEYFFAISASFGQSSVASLETVVPHGVSFLDFTYDAPFRRTFVNKVDTISITAMSPMFSTIHYTFQILIVP